MPFFGELKRRNVIRVAVAYLAAAWVLTEVASTLLPLFGVPDWGIRLIVVLFAVGFIPTLIFSWVYELTPEGLKREKDVVRDDSIAHLTGRRLDAITIALIVVALAFVVADRLWLAPWLEGRSTQPAQTRAGLEPTVETVMGEAVYPANSIAVLPFVNMSDDAANEFFSDGISEELLNLLAKIPELRVIARTSSFSYKGKGVKIADIARELNVGHVLEGSVRKAGNQVRITAQLIEAGSETHLWSEAYDRTLDDIFAIQDEIAGKVVEELKIALIGKAAPKARETNPEAYVWYLQCRPLSAGGLEENLRKAEEYCRRSLEIAPDYAPGWVSLAVVYTNLAIGGYIDYAHGYEQAHDFVLRALDLDPNLWSSYAWLGWYAAMHERDLATAAQYYRRALELAPRSSTISSHAASFARSLGRFERAIELWNQQLALDPLAGNLYGSVALTHCVLGQFEEAHKQYEMAFELAPEDHFMLAWFARCCLLQNQPDKALAIAERIKMDTRRLSISSMALHDLGRPEESDRALNELVEEYPDEAASFIASVYAWRGEADPAFEWLNRALAEEQYMWGWLVFDPAFGKLHGDPRWADIRARDGRSEEQLQKIDF